MFLIFAEKDRLAKIQADLGRKIKLCEKTSKIKKWKGTVKTFRALFIQGHSALQDSEKVTKAVEAVLDV